MALAQTRDGTFDCSTEKPSHGRLMLTIVGAALKIYA
jgi:hypothetical protein